MRIKWYKAKKGRHFILDGRPYLFRFGVLKFQSRYEIGQREFEYKLRRFRRHANQRCTEESD